ncbi:SURF1-like protein [Burkholderiales bacterium 8X]|nr:SURF1-like protein [Burkholderiales bacterium 8X]
MTGARSASMSAAVSQPAPTEASRAPRSGATLATLAVIGLLLLGVLVALGNWQVQRRAWKLDLMERVAERVAAPPVPAPAEPEWPRVDAAGHEYRHVVLEGQWLADRQTLVQASTDLGSGFWVLTPLQLAGGSQVLVNRGFIAASARPADAPPTPTGAVRVTGLLRMSEPAGHFPRRNDPAAERWFSRELPAIAKARGLTRVAPYFVDADAAARPASAGAGEPVGGLTVIRFQNNHLVYAITWYALAAMVLIAAWLVWRDERAVRQAAHNGRHDHG